jgi:hypothetical protein
MAREAKTKAAPAPMTLERLRQVLGTFRYTSTTESRLADEIAHVLYQRGVRFDRGVALAVDAAPVDFLIEGFAVAVRLEVDAAQLERYARSKRVVALLVVTRSPAVPAKLGGKAVSVLPLPGRAG